MRRCVYAVLCAAALVLSLSHPVIAQDDPMPRAGSVAVGADVGFFVPREGLDVGPSVGALVEFYALSRVGVRARVTTAGTGVSDGEGTLRRTWAAADVLYNWEAGYWHPFVAVGAGFFHVQRPAGFADRSDSRWGATFGGGVEYFARPHISFKTEVSYQLLERRNETLNPSGLVLTAGLKRYF